MKVHDIPLDLAKPGAGISFHEMTVADILTLIAMFADAADRARRAGFELIDVQRLRPHYALTLKAWVERLPVEDYRMIEPPPVPSLAGVTACFAQPASYEITWGGRKLVGSAQVRRRG